ncbi:MAG: hypothetical protein K0B02_05400 [DPANN group archaeon]|nr:hypothetical protein [DPANN group archaeon]
MIFCFSFFGFLGNDSLSESGTSIDVYFCPEDFCGDVLFDLIESSNKSVSCAFYDLELENVIDAIGSKNYRLVIDKDNTEHVKGKLDYVTNRGTWQLMHNKFCVIDDLITVTGSFNPTFRGDTKNNNNLVVVRSRLLASNYLDEFEELYGRQFSTGYKVKYPVMYLDGVRFENYFCPEDSCSRKVIDILSGAKISINFMTFSFTDDGIGDVLVSQHKDGVDVRGVFEKSQRNKWNEFEKLNVSGMDVVWDNNPFNMHHKVFIIDDSVVILGSFNPTNAGDTKNDENILVIYDEGIASKFMLEFDNVYGS